MSKIENTLVVRAAIQTANAFNDDTLHNWASDLTLHNNNEHASVDVTNDELDDTFEADMKALGHDTDAVFNMTDNELELTGRAFVYEAMELKGNNSKVIAAYKKAIKQRTKWLKTR